MSRGQDFGERLKRATRDYEEKSAAIGRASDERGKEQAGFLVAFQDKDRNIISPAIERAVDAFGLGEVSGILKRAPTNDRVALHLSFARKHAAVIFAADPLRMRVRVRSTIMDMDEIQSGARFDDPKRETDIATLTLDEVDTARVEDIIATYVESIL